jgi:AcrR family transcriptional regulator
MAAASGRIAGDESRPSDLSRAGIVARALNIADAESLDAVTVRRLAAEFDVTPMALYWHVKNKDELLAAMGDSVYADLALDTIADPATGPWNERLRMLLDDLVAALRRHPASAALAVPRILQCEAGQQLTEIALGLLHEAGFSIKQSADIARSALQTCIILVSGMPGAEFGVAMEHRPEIIALKRASIARLPAGRFPLLRESAGVLTDCEDDEEYFRFGADLFVAGVEALQGHLATAPPS